MGAGHFVSSGFPFVTAQVTLFNNCVDQHLNLIKFPDSTQRAKLVYLMETTESLVNYLINLSQRL